MSCVYVAQKFHEEWSPNCTLVDEPFEKILEGLSTSNHCPLDAIKVYRLLEKDPPLSMLRTKLQTMVVTDFATPLDTSSPISAAGDDLLVILPQPVPDVVEERADVLHPLEQRQMEFVDKARNHDGKSPFELAIPSEYRQTQNRTGAFLLDGRFDGNTRNPPVTAAIPIELYNPTFANFMSKSRDPTLKVSEPVARATAELIRECSAIRTTDMECDRIRAILSEILSHSNSQTRIPDYYNTESSTSEAFEHLPVRIAMTEVKPEMDSDGDPSVQASFRYAAYIADPEYDPIRQHSNCPCFLIGITGAWIIISGAVFTTRPIVQRLSPGYLWLGPSRTMDEQEVLNIARWFQALCESLDELEQYYTSLRPNDVQKDQRFYPLTNSYPHPTRGNVYFTYLTSLSDDDDDPTCATFLARTSEGENVVVKFSRRYNEDAHRLLAAAGYAPKLFRCGSLPHCGIMMVVMEHIVGETIYQEYDTSEPIPPPVMEGLHNALGLLERDGYIFPDLRRPNVMLVKGPVTAESVRFIDFDWVCKEGEGARYPFHLSPAVREAAGVEDYSLITRDHERSMLKVF